MKLARVLGRVVATERCPGLEGVRFLLLQPLSSTLEDKGRPVVAADAIDTASAGDLVTYVSSREAAVAMPEPFVPVDHAVLGLVDQVDLVATETSDGATEQEATEEKRAKGQAAKGEAAKPAGKAKRGTAKSPRRSGRARAKSGQEGKE